MTATISTRTAGQKAIDSGVVEAVVAVYPTHEAAETAIRAAQKSGFDMTKLSIIAKDYQTQEDVVGYYSTGGRMKAWGKSGAFWGGLWGLLFGSAFFVIPGVGPLLVAGPLLMSIIAALEGAVVVGTVSVVGAALISIGVPKDKTIEYEARITAGEFLVVAHGTAHQLGAIRDTLGTNSQQYSPLQAHAA